ncbi:hypothetical protein [Microvirga roseola]|uniref:hypothetical protein n=1 Tax=Microvirga roseola TaxID=2883126 RepID=UPI001E2DD3DB|nr:hypothetical protein [Microvirga roseola]
MDRKPYLDALVSRPWSREHHCWDLVRRIRRDLFGCEALPPFGVDLVDDPRRRRDTFKTHPARADWVEVFAPADGDVVIMTKPGTLHAGIYLLTQGRGLVWHSDQPHGVAAETVTEVRELRRWNTRFFRKNP